MSQYHLQTLNKLYTPGVKTYLKYMSQKILSSTIDIAITNDYSLIHEFQVDTHSCYRDHRPIVATLKLQQLRFIQDDPSFSFCHHSSKVSSHNDSQEELIEKFNEKMYSFKNRFISSDPIVCSKIITLSSYWILFTYLINTYGLRRINTNIKWQNGNIDIASIIAEMELFSHSDSHLLDLEKRYNKKLSELKQNRISNDAKRIQSLSFHKKEKYLKRLFNSQNPLANLPNVTRIAD